MNCFTIFSIIFLSVAILYQVYCKSIHYPPLYSTQQQQEITKELILLNNNGHIIEEGWARKPFWKYNRSQIKDFTKLRTKEWDYYATISQTYKFGLAATISDLGYGALLALTYIDLENSSTYQIDTMKFFTFGNMNLSSSSDIDNSVFFSNDDFSLRFDRRSDKRYLFFSAPKMNISGRIGLFANLTLSQPTELESINIATSWKEDRSCFYLNEKVNMMETKGTVKIGDDEFHLIDKDAYTVLDWGRWKWTYQNRWYWSSLSSATIGFNLGYGFSDRSPATENVLFYENRVHKLGNVKFDIPIIENEKVYDQIPWKVYSDDGKLNLTFTPIVDRKSNVNFVVIKSVQHQVFGKFNGTATLDNGKIVQISDLYGFAEDVFNRW